MRHLNKWRLLCFIFLCLFLWLLVRLVVSLTVLPPIHIFLEVYATTPAFLEMVEMVQLPENEPKFFAFHRFPKRSEKVDLKSINAVEIDIAGSEGMYSASSQQFYKKLKKYLEKYKNNPIVLYGNRAHFLKTYAQLLKEVDPKRIKCIHLFEDGFGGGGNHGLKNMIIPSEAYIVSSFYACLAGRCSSEGLVNLGLHKIYPTVYHIAFKDRIMFDAEPSFSGLRQFWKGANVQDVLLSDIPKKLSPEQKEFLLDMIGFDWRDFIKKTKGHRVGILCSGYVFGEKMLEAEINALKKIIEESPKDVVWFLKLHPSYSANAQNEKLQKEFSNLSLISAQVPLEALLLSVPIDFVAGYRSSLFFATPPDKIFKIIGSLDEPIIQGLLSLKQIRKDQVLSLN